MATEEQIRELAYSIWEQEGRPEGKDVEHYYRSRQILEEQGAASPAVKAQLPPVSSLQLPSPPKPVERLTGKRRSKKA
jgi:hypothetical protein